MVKTGGFFNSGKAYISGKYSNKNEFTLYFYNKLVLFWFQPSNRLPSGELPDMSSPQPTGYTGIVTKNTIRLKLNKT